MSQPKNKSKSNNLSTITVALTLCLVCSVLVSAVAVGLKPKQDENARLDRNKNILLAAGELQEEDDSEAVKQKFADFEPRIIDLQTGKVATDDQLKQAGIDDVNAYDTSSASKIANLSNDLGDDDPASIGRVPKFAKVYVKEGTDGATEAVVLPVYGYGLWGTIYGFFSIGSDMNTIEGISFYSHKETPGLGARVEESEWRAQWKGISAYDEQGNVATGVTKAGNHKENYVDGISGATLTGRGVNNFIQFWLSERGYKPFLDNMKEEGQISAATANSINSSTDKEI